MEYVLSLSWPGSTCQMKNCTYYGRKNYFSIHGLWPEYGMDCNKIDILKMKISEQNMEDIEQYWSSMYNSETWFINHELSKHGSCWDPTRSDINQTPQYIQKVLDKHNLEMDSLEKINLFLELTMSWSKHNNVYEILLNNGLSPSERDLTTPKIVAGILDNHFGTDGGVFPICIGKNHNKYFSEIRFCLDKNYQVIECGTKVVSQHLNQCASGMSYPLFPDF